HVLRLCYAERTAQAPAPRLDSPWRVPAAMTAAATTDEAAFRLPHEVVPRRYQLTLAPDIPNSRFEGEEIISIEVQQPVRSIVLNAIELEIRSAVLRRDGAAPLPAQVSLDAETERATLAFDAEVPAGPAELHIGFTGTLNDKL